jgi:hypothetical protein
MGLFRRSIAETFQIYQRLRIYVQTKAQGRSLEAEIRTDILDAFK